MVPAELPAWVSGTVAMGATAAATWWMTWRERKERKKEEPVTDMHAQVVAATFTERGQMERLISALIAVERVVLQSVESTDHLVRLLEADERRREMTALLEHMLKNGGIELKGPHP